MKKTTNFLLSICGLMILLFANSSCSKEKTLNIAEFIGSYSAREDCEGEDDKYTIDINPLSSSEEAVIIYNLYNWGEPMNAIITKGNRIEIPIQQSYFVTFQGEGYFDGEHLTIEFTVSDDISSDKCKVVCRRN